MGLILGFMGKVPLLAWALVAVLAWGGWHRLQAQSARAEFASARADAIEAAAETERLRNASNIRVTDDYRKKAQTAAVSAAGLRTERDRLLAELADRAPADPAAGPGTDEAAATASALGECVTEYSAVAQVADQLATQTAGLQSYVGQVCLIDNPKEESKP